MSDELKENTAAVEGAKTEAEKPATAIKPKATKKVIASKKAHKKNGNRKKGKKVLAGKTATKTGNGTMRGKIREMLADNVAKEKIVDAMAKILREKHPDKDAQWAKSTAEAKVEHRIAEKKAK